MDPTTILYGMSTLAQTCAALAALVGALGLYRLQSIRNRQADVERQMRQMLVNVVGSWEWAQSVPTHLLVDQHAVAFARGGSAAAPRMQGYLDEWQRFDPDYRRTSKLLGGFITWNILTIGISLIGFAFVHRLAWSSVPVFGLWGLTIGTVVATVIMVMEMRDSFVRRFGHIRWLEDG